MTTKHNTTEDNARKNNATSQPLPDAKIDLTNLWQQQSSFDVNVKRIKKQSTVQMRKQRLYMLIDILSLLPFLLIFVIDQKLTASLKGFILANFIASVLTVTYIIRLRCVAAFGKSETIQDYKANLLNQLKNNAKIARLNKHLCWIVVLALCVIFSVTAWQESWTLQQAIRKVGVSLSIVGLVLLPWFIWAAKRQKRFEDEALVLEASNFAKI